MQRNRQTYRQSAHQTEHGNGHRCTDPIKSAHAPDSHPPRHPYPPHNEEIFLVDIDGFEGPLDLLLAHAKTQKLDLKYISILELAHQYLRFMQKAQKLRLDNAAEYLLMAAYLAYLKSALLMPKQTQKQENQEDIIEKLKIRMIELQIMRQASEKIMKLNQLGQDVFERAIHENNTPTPKYIYRETLYQLLSSYAENQRKNAIIKKYEPRNLPIISVKKIRDTLKSIMRGNASGNQPGGEWKNFTSLIRQCTLWEKKEKRHTITASAFAALLEMAREGDIDIKQDHDWGALKIKNKIHTAKHTTNMTITI